MAESDYGGWEKLERLGRGGQGEVFKARTPTRAEKRQEWLDAMETAWSVMRPVRGAPADAKPPMPYGSAGHFAMLCYEYARPDTDDELGALKIYDMAQQDDEEIEQAIERYEIELKALNELKEEPGILKLLASSRAPLLLATQRTEFWIVTEYMPNGSLSRLKNLQQYTGNALLSLKAFRSIVSTVKLLHDRGWEIRGQAK